MFELVLAGSTFHQAIILLDYKVNHEYIASVLCVNKSKPASCCKGKCYVKNKLNNQENNEKSAGGKENAVTEWFFDEAAQDQEMTFGVNEFFESVGRDLPFHPSPGVFHPPHILGA